MSNFLHRPINCKKKGIQSPSESPFYNAMPIFNLRPYFISLAPSLWELDGSVFRFLQQQGSTAIV